MIQNIFPNMERDSTTPMGGAAAAKLGNCGGTRSMHPVRGPALWKQFMQRATQTFCRTGTAKFGHLSSTLPTRGGYLGPKYTGG